MDDPAAFQALVKTLDREAVGKLVYLGYGRPLNIPAVPGSFFYKDIPMEYDPAAAKEELAALGYEEGDINIEILTWTGLKNLEDTAVIWCDGMAEAGVNCSVTVMDNQVLFDKYNRHDYQILTDVWAPPPDPGYHYDVIWAPHLADWYLRPEVEALIQKARETLDPEERKLIYHELFEIGVNDGPDLVVWQEPFIVARNERVRGLVVDPLTFHNWERVWVEQ